MPYVMPQPPKPSSSTVKGDALSKELQQFLEALVLLGDNLIKIA